MQNLTCLPVCRTRLRLEPAGHPAAWAALPHERDSSSRNGICLPEVATEAHLGGTHYQSLGAPRATVARLASAFDQLGDDGPPRPLLRRTDARASPRAVISHPERHLLQQLAAGPARLEECIPCEQHAPIRGCLQTCCFHPVVHLTTRGMGFDTQFPMYALCLRVTDHTSAVAGLALRRAAAVG